MGRKNKCLEFSIAFFFFFLFPSLLFRFNVDEDHKIRNGFFFLTLD